MKAALFLALSVSYAAPAFSQPANKAALAEASRYLIPCNQVPAGDREWCPQAHDDFLDDYVRAKAGNPDYMYDLTHFFGTKASSAVHPPQWGIRPDRQEGCAWLLAAAAFTPSPAARSHLASEINLACIDFTADAKLAIWLRATNLVGEIRTNPAKEPPPDTAIDPKSLDSSATPLSAKPTSGNARR